MEEEQKLILVVEDEPSIADNIVYALKTERFVPRHVATAAEAIESLEASLPALLILDVGLPDVGGFELARKVKATYPELPLIFLTARSDEIDRIVGLELGADDYVVKPFSPRELAARVRAVLRRVAPRQKSGLSSQVSYGPFEIDSERRRISYFGELLELTPYEFKILQLLLKRPGKVFSRSELMSRLWDEPDMSLERTIDSHIKSLRQKLRGVREEVESIITHRGVGYALKEF